MTIVNRAFLILLAAMSFAAGGYAQTPARSATFHKRAERAYLGVGVADLTDDRVKALGLKNDSGVEVKLVEENSPALRAGLKANDVILKINGKVVEGGEQFIRIIGDAGGGAKVNMTVWRSGAEHLITATLDSRQVNPFLGDSDAAMPPMPPMPSSGIWDGNTPFSSLAAGSGALVGFEGETLSAQLAEYFGVKDGVLVRTVGARTPADRAGIKAGDVVTKVNGTPVSTPREISGLVRTSRSKTASFTVVRGKKEITLSVEISELRMPAYFGEGF